MEFILFFQCYYYLLNIRTLNFESVGLKVKFDTILYNDQLYEKLLISKGI